MNAHVIRAIFRRNFTSYFSNPTGYVFICVFVLLSSIAAFWPNEFFNSNLANLDQLNIYLPYILLFFIPAITMSIWADERRQGTDELLLTIPAGDFDVVLGKYLAAVAIFSVALMFSMVSYLLVLWVLGEPDPGLFFATYFGYWVVGWSMLAIGMVASFLTGNLTVGFVLGALFNVPLAFAASADVIVKDSDWAVAIERWSIANQFHDFSRGVISFSSVAYFVGIIALMLYLCMVLIGRRHWRGGQEGRNVAIHYAIRFVALLLVVLSIDVFLAHHDTLRADVTAEGLSSLAPDTRKLLKDLNPKYPIQVYAYVSENVPENYVQTKLNLLSTLSELKAAAGDKIVLDVRTIDPLSPDATQAEQQFGIRPQPVQARSRGTRAPEDIFLAVAVTCGLDKVVIPFFDRGLPVEYEIVRSIATVAQQKRKRVGVLTTDAKLYGGFDMQSMSSTRNELIIDELQKQYDVVQVDATNPIQDQYDVLLAVQPSSLGPQQMGHFIAAVKAGQPTAIFEDPFPGFASDVPGTAAEKQPPGGIQGMMGAPAAGRAQGKYLSLVDRAGSRLRRQRRDLAELQSLSANSRPHAQGMGLRRGRGQRQSARRGVQPGRSDHLETPTIAAALSGLDHRPAFVAAQVHAAGFGRGQDRRGAGRSDSGAKLHGLADEPESAAVGTPDTRSLCFGGSHYGQAQARSLDVRQRARSGRRQRRYGRRHWR